MHVLFVHQNYPAQFGHVAQWLVREAGWKATFVSERPAGVEAGVERIHYRLAGGATKQNHYCSRSFENYIWHSHAVYDAMRARPDIRPDVIVGHSGFGSTLFLRELYPAPIVNYFEYYYHPHGGDMDFRPEFPPLEIDVLRAHARNAMLLLDLQTCTAGYSPTQWQRSLFPAEYQPKLSTIFDGIDTTFWKPMPEVRAAPLVIGDRTIDPRTRVVTYVSRGFESMRGFDIFIEVARRLCAARQDVLFLCVGSDRICYGGDAKHIQAPTFREHVLAQRPIDPERFLFTGPVPQAQLAQILARSDLHLYLTVPFVLSWSLMNALSCGATVLASNTLPVAEMVRHGENGLLAGFYDIDAFVEQAQAVLDDPAAYVPLGRAARDLIEHNYALELVLPRIQSLLERAALRPR